MAGRRNNNSGQEVELAPLYIAYVLGLILPPLDLIVAAFVLPRYQSNWGASHIFNIMTVSAVRLGILMSFAIADYFGMSLLVLWAMIWPIILVAGLWMVVREIRGLVLLTRKQPYSNMFRAIV